MDTTHEIKVIENLQTVSEKRVILSVKEIIGILIFFFSIGGSWVAVSNKFVEQDQRINQLKENNIDSNRKFDKIDQKLDAIQADVIDVKLKLKSVEAATNK